MSHPPKHPDPTPEEIAAACADIQAEWSEDEKRHRAGIRSGVDMRVFVPRCKAPHSVDYEP